MKLFVVLLLCCSIKIINSDEATDSETNTYLERKCEKATSENLSICEKYRKMKSQLKMRTTVYAEFENYDNKTGENDFISVKLPVNTCKTEDCEFCCLSSNKCGTKRQCENSKYYIKIVHAIFISLIVILFTFLVVKCYKTDSLPDQTDKDKVKPEDMKNLISLYSLIRGNRAKLQS
jgi:hypothetical protein